MYPGRRVSLSHVGCSRMKHKILSGSVIRCKEIVLWEDEVGYLMIYIYGQLCRPHKVFIGEKFVGLGSLSSAVLILLLSSKLELG